MAIRHFLDLDIIHAETLRHIIEVAKKMKHAGKRVPKKLRPPEIEDAVLILIFEKPSTRTRVSFDIGMRQLGGQTINLNNSDLQLGRGESTVDTARVLSRYADIIMIRADSHDTVTELAEHGSIPIINGLTDKSHPCQVMADVLTFEEAKGDIAGKTITYIGDGNNMATSWIHAAVQFGFKLRIACPDELAPDSDVVAWANAHKGALMICDDAKKAAQGADCVVTDTWVSMGQEGADRRKALLKQFQVNDGVMNKAADDAIFMHCLPAYRGNEVTADVIDGPRSVVFDEAENRLHAQKAILAWCLGA